MEIWKTIPSLPNYEASCYGQLRRATASRGTRAGRVITQQSLPAGYRIACFQLDGATVGRLVHRVVIEAHIGPCPAGMEVNHIDSDKANNRIENLEYVTRSQNLLHAVASTGAYRGERNSQAIITPDIVREIRQQHAAGMGYKRLAKHFGLTWGLVRSVATCKTWAHIK